MVNRLKMANVQAIQVLHKQGWAGRRIARLLKAAANVLDGHKSGGRRFDRSTATRIG